MSNGIPAIIYPKDFNPYFSGRPTNMPSTYHANVPQSEPRYNKMHISNITIVNDTGADGCLSYETAERMKHHVCFDRFGDAVNGQRITFSIEHNCAFHLKFVFIAPDKTRHQSDKQVISFTNNRETSHEFSLSALFGNYVYLPPDQPSNNCCPVQ